MDNTRMVESYPYFEAVAREEGFYSKELMEELAQKGSLQTLEVPDWVKEVFTDLSRHKPRLARKNAGRLPEIHR